MTYEHFKYNYINISKDWAIYLIMKYEDINKEQATHMYKQLRKQYIEDRKYLI